MKYKHPFLLKNFKELKIRLGLKLMALKLHLNNIVKFSLSYKHSPFSVLKNTLAIHAIKNRSFKNFRIRVVDVKKKIRMLDKDISWKEVIENQSRLLHKEMNRFWMEESPGVKKEIIKKWKKTNL